MSDIQIHTVDNNNNVLGEIESIVCPNILWSNLDNCNFDIETRPEGNTMNRWCSLKSPGKTLHPEDVLPSDSFDLLFSPKH